MFLNLLDIPPPAEYAASAVGVGLAVVFFLVFIGVALFSYKMLKRTMKMAFRMVIVAVILLVAVVGSLALYFGIRTEKPQRSSPPQRQTPRPASSR